MNLRLGHLISKKSANVPVSICPIRVKTFTSIVLSMAADIRLTSFEPHATLIFAEDKSLPNRLANAVSKAKILYPQLPMS